MICLISSFLRDDLRMKWAESTYSHINYMAYARYFIPEYVKSDRALYLDCDLVVLKTWITCLIWIWKITILQQ